MHAADAAFVSARHEAAEVGDHAATQVDEQRLTIGRAHGEAVAMGMICEAWLSWRQGLLPREDSDRIAAHLLSLYKPFALQGDEDHRIIELMRNDKKNSAGQFRFALLTGIGSAQVDAAINAAQVKEALDHYRLLVRG